MWEIDNLSQLIAFLLSVAVGCVFCLIYDIFRAVRKSFKQSGVAVFFEDILYSFICAVLSFCFLLSTTGGELRVFVFVGMGIGFSVCRFTLSRPIFSAMLFVLRFFRFLQGKISRLLSVITAATDKCGGKIRIFFKFLINTLKKGLKKK